MARTHVKTAMITWLALVSAAGCGGALPTAPGATAPGASAGAFELSGLVLGDAVGAGGALDGVDVIVSRDDQPDGSGRAVVTDASGRFSVQGLGAGLWNIALKKRGFADRTMDVSIKGNVMMTFSLLPMSLAAFGGAVRP